LKSGQLSVSQIVRTEQPLNSEPPLERLSQDFVTPTELFYVRNHGSIPEIDPASYVLSVEGAVKRPLRLSIDEIRNEFEPCSVTAALQCAGNRRSELSAIRPVSGEVPWGAQAIGNAVWTGARLSHVLEMAGVERKAEHVAFVGLDVIEKEGSCFGFGASVAMKKAMSPETILAYEMNGEPLSRIHGFPIRGIVPGYIGARSVKWLGTITVQDEPSTNYYQAHSYKLFPPDATSETAVWEEGITLEETAMNSVICEPVDGATLPEGPVTVRGYAIGLGGTPVDRVEIRIEGGASWIRADITERRDAWSWCLWEASLNLSPGMHRIIARARDSKGNVQPDDGSQLWNFKGYGYNARHIVSVRVE
jgi:sulfite oxidase